MSNGDEIDLARRKLLKGAYVAPVVLGVVVLSWASSANAQPRPSCGPASCPPIVGCNPDNCNPNNCNPQNCNPINCNPSMCRPRP